MTSLFQRECYKVKTTLKVKYHLICFINSKFCTLYTNAGHINYTPFQSEIYFMIVYTLNIPYNFPDAFK